MRQSMAIYEQLLPVGVGDLPAFVRAANAVPMLSEEEELTLGRELRQSNNVQAAQRLILSHLRFVIRIARDYRHYGLPQADLIQEGNVGLMMAVKRFDPEMGVRLAAYAVHWIRARIYEFVLKNWRIVKVVTNKAQRKLFFNLHRMKKHLGWFSREQVEAVATELGVKPEEVLEMEERLAGRDMLYDPWSHGDEEEPGRGQPQAYLADPNREPLEQVESEQKNQREQQALQQALQTLPQRSRDILQRRWLDEPKAPLKELAAEYGVSMERVRQIEVAAIEALRKKMGHLAA